MSDPVTIARAAWGAALPDWVLRLAEECARSSQNKVAAKLDRSAALVSNVIRAKYTGNLAAVEDLVRGHFFAETIRCPALGDISKAACRDWMRAAARFSNINSERVRMFRACNGCPRMQKDAAA
jgi:hypothetical protein